MFNIQSSSVKLQGYSSIVIEGTEYSKYVTGLNIVVYDLSTCKVIDAVTFSGTTLLR